MRDVCLAQESGLKRLEWLLEEGQDPCLIQALLKSVFRVIGIN